jgi:hypothetical protein
MQGDPLEYNSAMCNDAAGPVRPFDVPSYDVRVATICCVLTSEASAMKQL